MSDFVIVTSCAPTLAGMKTGSLFTAPYTSRKAMEAEIGQMNRIMEPKGIRMVSMRYNEKRVLIYMYRPEQLKRDLEDEEARRILRESGYADLREGVCVRTLRGKFAAEDAFPHEIGLFLGYPSEDVRGYIENGGNGSKYIGYWKVYGNVIKAKEIFAKYKKCTKTYYNQWTAGRSISELAVAM